MKQKLIAIFLFIFSCHIYSQNYALINGEVHTVTKGILQEGTVLISNGIIEEAGNNIPIPEGYETINCTGLKIYPGLIDAGTSLGLKEIGSLPETIDFMETGDFNPDVKAITAVNPNSELIPVTRVNGITTVLAEPSGGLFSGQSALINLYGYTHAEITVKERAGIHLRFPVKGRPSSFEKEKLDEREKQFKKRMKALNDVWEIAENYFRNYRSGTLTKKDFRFEPFIDLFEKKIPLIISVNNDFDILRAIDWVKEKDIEVIFSGVLEGWRVAGEISKAGIPCLAGNILTLPQRAEDKFDAPYTNLEVLRKAGVKTAFRSGGTENVRNLPYELATAISYGMPSEEALKAVTIIPAEIFKVDDKIGSIEKGKTANIIVSNGDIFEVKSNPVHIFIKGKKIPLTSRHTELYEQFKNRE
jgi:imidazolonepropionase-like amidohydrolase